MRISIGQPIFNTQVYILDRHLNPLPVGIPGELHVGGIAVARGYLRRPELTAENFIPNPFGTGRLYKTGDLARYLPDGNIEFLGRIDHQVKIRGFRIELGEIEAILAQHPQVEEVVVIARDDRPGDQYLVAYIVPDQTAVPSPEELRQFLKQKLPAYMVPAAFMPLEALPLTPNGKLDRRSLPAPDWQQQTHASFVAPRNPVEQQLADIWATILWREQPVGVHDNFFDLGGHSLLAVRLVAEIEKSFKTKLPLAALFQLTTVAELAEFLAERKPETENLVEATDSSGEVEKAKDVRRFPPLDPEIHHQLLAFTAGWKGQRVTPDSLVVGLNTQGTLPPLFWCLQGFRELSQLAKYIGAEQAVYGMRSGHLIMSYTEENIQALAAHYVREILRVQPEGSYRLGGNCQAGILIFEIAQQLQQQGKTVAILCLLEAFIPKPYFGQVALFFGQESDRFNPYKSFAEPEFAYRKFYQGGFSVNIVSGDHGQYFSEPNIQVFAGKLRETLDRVQTDESVILSEEAYRSQLSTVTSLTARAGDTLSLDVTVKNISPVTWLETEKSGIFLANHWLDEKGEVVRWLDSRVPLDRDLLPNSSVQLEFTIIIPEKAGQYTLELDLVEEGVTWFKNKGSETVTVQVEVTASESENERLDRIEKNVISQLTDLEEKSESDNSTTIVEFPITEDVQYRQQGNERFEKGEFMGAIEFYQKAISLNPKQPFELYFNLGKALSATGQIPEAIACYKKVIQLQPSFPDVYWTLGNLQRQEGKIDKAISNYQTALQIEPTLIWLYPILAQVLAQEGKRDVAISTYQKAIELESDRPGLYLNLGNLLFQNGEIDSAIANYRKEIEFNLEEVRAYMGLGHALSKKEQFSEAIATFKKVIELSPNHCQAHQLLGHCQQKQEDWEGAISSYQKAIELQPKNFNTYFQLGHCQQKKGEIERAIASYLKAIALKPHPHVYYLLGNALNQQGSIEEAIDAYSESVKLNPHPHVYYVLGNAQRQQGQIEEAIASYHKAIELKHQNPFGVYKALGELLTQTGAIEEAISAYQKALQLQPDNPAIQRCLKNLGDPVNV